MDLVVKFWLTYMPLYTYFLLFLVSNDAEQLKASRHEISKTDFKRNITSRKIKTRGSTPSKTRGSTYSNTTKWLLIQLIPYYNFYSLNHFFEN